MASGSSTQRRLDLKLAGYRYRYEAPYGEDVCVYCGDPATTVDHVPPLSRAAALADIMGDIRKIDFVMYPACRDCNLRLATFAETALTKRRAELRCRLRKKYRRLLGQYD